MDDHRGHNVYFLYTIQWLKPPTSHLSASRQGLNLRPPVIYVLGGLISVLWGVSYLLSLAQCRWALLMNVYLTSYHNGRLLLKTHSLK